MTTSVHSAAEADHSLASIKLLGSLDRQSLRHFEDQCSWRHAKEGDQLLSRDSDSRDVFFVARGRVRIVNFSHSGREIAFGVAGTGDYFGELAAIDGLPRSATVVALEDCRLAALSPQGFKELIEGHPRVALLVMEKLAKIIRTCDDRIMDLATLSAYQRVYSEVLKLMKPDPVRTGSWLVYPLPTQAQIAAQASTTRETVARVLSHLAIDGIAERKSKTLYIRSPDKLKQLCERHAGLNKEED
ncbi:MAG TPA: Crp/Fnr family transcriptional regulator [Alphaproteobacteria bacterium]|nr:Crp/Fnr family transcriptional regulator [Alphaproteobacteria bacterium]HAJ46032.1 Crp/Fnr family transcriptional regulator [Alphaproteobacteria bacterium]